ncbi:formate--tetrahydrofolate ligase, partial [Brenneria sp. 4F2]|nr:formate--tetrahydrofolate ligase [Brenneria bubanii]
LKAAKRERDNDGKLRQFQPLQLDLKKPVPSDFEISRAQQPKEIKDVALEAGILPSEVEPYGSTKAKVSLKLLDRLQNRKNGKYVIVTG